jgi:hypothetical protein
MPVHRRVSNALSSAAISRCAGCDLPDTQSGYRAIAAPVLRRVHPDGERYEFETDFLIRAARAGFRIECVPIPTIYGSPSHFREIRDALRVVQTIWRHRHEALQAAREKAVVVGAQQAHQRKASWRPLSRSARSRWWHLTGSRVRPAIRSPSTTRCGP